MFLQIPVRKHFPMDFHLEQKKNNKICNIYVFSINNNTTGQNSTVFLLSGILWLLLTNSSSLISEYYMKKGNFSKIFIIRHLTVILSGEFDWSSDDHERNVEAGLCAFADSLQYIFWRHLRYSSHEPRGGNPNQEGIY